ncbi:histidine--tRNA ligase [Bryobacter aggregatus]|uniref:histidine--tRNA ligase n=1 Tax=Bryobacter aggregatus TaxID=360054 RepID=UPI0004E13828|nr:histidine--tRNA ligase [Bryobacter aggregatus]
MSIKAVKGTRDLLPPAISVWNHVEAVSRRLFQSYNYQEIRTPIFEETALFARGVGAETDIVTKEMYTFEDRDGSSLTLRPENTASVIRAYIEHRLDQIPGLQKLFYIGPMFRRERPQKGRYRQFSQIGAEVIGSDSPVVDAEVIEMVCALLDACGVSGYKLMINSVGTKESRPAFVNAIREQLLPVVDKLSADSQRRLETNPLRILDSKAPEDQPYIEALPSIHEYLDEDSRVHFARLREYLEDRSIAYTVTPRMVRGLDYYMRTTFEIIHEGALGSQNSVLGGGRYDGLAESLGGRVPAPGIGFSIGEDRLVMTVDEAQPGQFGHTLDCFIAPLDESSFRHVSLIARELRRDGIVVELAAAGKVKRAMELANKLSARFALLVGEQEVANGQYSLKNMKTGEQISVPREDLKKHICQTV